jgi:hypothetical protein
VQGPRCLAARTEPWAPPSIGAAASASPGVGAVWQVVLGEVRAALRGSEGRFPTVPPCGEGTLQRMLPPFAHHTVHGSCALASHGGAVAFRIAHTGAIGDIVPNACYRQCSGLSLAPPQGSLT